MIASLALLAPLLAQGATLSWEAPKIYIEGEPFPVTIRVEVHGEDPVALPSWDFGPSAFSVGGTPLGERAGESFLTLAPGQVLETTFDLGATLEGLELKGRAVQIAFDPAGGDPREVVRLQMAPQGIDFMTLPQEQLADYQVVMRTIAGPLWMELWPDVAPNHVRNFLDLAYTGFYDDNEFHRVIPGFMIQGGGAKPGKLAPRTLKNEFNERRHVPGVLSMARMGVDTRDKDGNVIPANDSATSEFFVMHAVYPSLDGKYTAFGKLIDGMDVVEKIVHSGNPAYPPRDPRAHKPVTRQTIYKAIVVKAPKR